MAAAAVGADKKGGKRRLAPAVMFALLGASLLAACAPLGPQTVEPGVTPGQQPAEVQEVVIVPTEEPTETPTEEPTETPEPTAEPTATPEPEMGMQNEQGQWWNGSGWLDLPGEGWLVEVLEDGQVQATDTSGANYTWVEGKWLTEAQIETQKVVEYVAANSEVINRVPMEHVEFRASNRLQHVISGRVPEELRSVLGEKPLYMMVWNPEKLQELIGGISIKVAGMEDKVRLGDYKLVVTFLSKDEKIPEVFLDQFHGGASDGFRYEAYLEDGKINLVIRLASYASTGYNYMDRDEVAIVFSGLLNALGNLSGNNSREFEMRFAEDTKYDDNNFLEEERGITYFLHPGVGDPRRGSGTNYANMDYYRVLHEQGWIPEEVWGMIQ